MFESEDVRRLRVEKGERDFLCMIFCEAPYESCAYRQHRSRGLTVAGIFHAASSSRLETLMIHLISGREFI